MGKFADRTKRLYISMYWTYPILALGIAFTIISCDSSSATPNPAATAAKRSALERTATLELPGPGVTISDDFPDYGSDECLSLCRRLYADGVRSVAVTPCGVMRTTNTPDVRWTRWSKRNYVDAIRKIRGTGMSVMLKPYIWSNEFYSMKKWTGHIRFPDGESRDAWFRSYTAFMLDNARFAAESGAEILCIGLELPGMSIYTQQWRNLIDTLRAVYPGMLTYAAHGIEEARKILFWDDLDFIGVNLYPSLSDSPAPKDDELRASWQTLIEQLSTLAAKNNKKLVLTETGFRSVVGAAYRPWEWPEHEQRKVSMTQQKQAYRILAEQCYRQQWFGGIYWWKFFTHPDAGGVTDQSFTPQGKPAYAQMIRDFAQLRDHSKN